MQTMLHSLCKQLLQKRGIIASGKLRLICLENIKKRAGENWNALKPFVYDIVEESIKKYKDPDDLFIRYHDDQYILIFANMYEETEVTTALIAGEIRRRLFGDLRWEPERLRTKCEATQEIAIIEVESYKCHLRHYA